MTVPRLGPEQARSVLREQGALLAATPEPALGAPVPAVPEWTAEHVLRHTAKVHRWVVSVLRAGPGADLGGLEKALAPSPRGAQAISHYRESLDQLLAEFDKRDPAEPAATFAGPRTVGWWARRQAHETLIHRHDAQSAHEPRPASAEPLAAADGVDEWVELFVPRAAIRGKKPFPDSLSGKQIAVEALDVPGARWMLHAGSALAGARSDEPPDATLSLPAWELLLTVWRRRPLDPAAVAGEQPVVRALYDYVRI